MCGAADRTALTFDKVLTYMYPCSTVPPKKPYTLKIDTELLAALRNIKTRDGIGESEQIRRGIQLWLKQKGVTIKTERKRADTRKRS
jgi:hypothetical protein